MATSLNMLRPWTVLLSVQSGELDKCKDPLADTAPDWTISFDSSIFEIKQINITIVITITIDQSEATFRALSSLEQVL
jgi:hypothetical protein